MNRDEQKQHFQTADPDAYDRAYGQAQGFPHTKPSTITAANVMGIGGVRSYIVETFRLPEVGDTVFVQITGPGRLAARPLAAISHERDSTAARLTHDAIAQASGQGSRGGRQGRRARCLDL